ncbi:MAG: glycosyltransferase family 4 protein [Pseudomonadota bacterium]
MVEAYFAIPGDLATQTGGYAYDRRLMKELPALGVEVHHLGLPDGFPNPSVRDVDETVKALQTTPEAATILIDGLAFGALPKSAVAQINRRLVALIHHPLALEAGLSDADKNRLVSLERDALSLADRVIATSPTTADVLSGDYGVEGTLITVAEPGTDPAQRATGTAMPLQLLCVGAVSPRKGYDILIEALRPMSEQSWRMTIAGALDRDPKTSAKLERLIEDSGFSEQITLAGVVVPATLDKLYESADLFVMPSLYEGYGMVLAEAMARGLPIVCTTGGAAAETVPDAAALKVPPGDIAALSRALADAMADKKLRARLADAAWDAGRKLPTWQETARRVAAAIMDLRS